MSKIVPLNPKRYLLHKAILTILRVIEDLPNSQKQNGETKKYTPNERSREIPLKIIT